MGSLDLTVELACQHRSEDENNKYIVFGLVLQALIEEASSSSPPDAVVLQLTGTTELDYHANTLREGISSLASLSSTGLLLAVLVTGLIYLTSLASPLSSGIFTRKRGPDLYKKNFQNTLLSFTSSTLDDLMTLSKLFTGTLDYSS
eukprot:TRINITY_DN37383_c0_g1_i1.p1 TRINITY_DN37383_c0_g1~~TRINITY_DN37383_c0_g1_i1.p1  ORF type:complete len:154 (-),score=39.64 TRINITY_DN37383_c0_g1_i1:23-460(-)